MSFRGGKFLLGLGAVIGTVFGLSMAQRKGSEFRKDVYHALEKEDAEGKVKLLKSEATSFWHELQKAWHEFTTHPKVKKAIKKGKETLGEMAEEGQERAKDAFKKMTDEGKDKFKSAKHHIEDKEF